MTVKSSSNSTQVSIGDAWSVHRSGNNSEAISKFSQVLTTVPDNVDALYGLGLAQDANGDKRAAAESFQKALTILGETTPEGKEERDRYMMLTRMLNQRIAETQT